MSELFNTIIKSAASRWNPRFTTMGNIDEVADLINRPHEDYPLRVQATRNIIAEMIEWGIHKYNDTLLRMVHGEIMFGCDHRGLYRTVNVRVGDHLPPEHYLVPDLMKQILPVFKEDNMPEWYSLFQTIHPFQDGNGRAGGVVIATLSFLQTGKYLTPCQ